MSVRIIVDSASDITQEEAKELNITVLPMTTHFGDEEFIDGITMSHEEFFEKLVETDVFPQTSQLSPYAYEEAFREVKEAGDTAVYIALSSKLSGGYQSAVIGSEGYEDIIEIVDSENVCIGQRLLVLRAVELRKEGKTAKEIAAVLDKEKKEVRLIALLDTLEYLKKGGRISAAVALAGTLLSIKPVIAIENGEVSMLGKARGSKNGNNLLKTLIEKEGGIDFEKPYALAYSGLSDKLLRKYIEDNKDLYEGQADHLPITTIGCIIGTHAGPGAIAVAFFSK